VGVTVYRTAFGQPGAKTGPADGLMSGASVWVLPNPTGLNAHWTAATLAAEFARLREAAG
jgi:double-stranded uracil-DNA glycosylase